MNWCQFCQVLLVSGGAASLIAMLSGLGALAYFAWPWRDRKYDEDGIVVGGIILILCGVLGACLSAGIAGEMGLCKW